VWLIVNRQVPAASTDPLGSKRRRSRFAGDFSINWCRLGLSVETSLGTATACIESFIRYLDTGVDANQPALCLHSLSRESAPVLRRRFIAR